jgi:hypothetical protein
MSKHEKGVMPSSPDFSEIDPLVYLYHIGMNPQAHFDLAKEFADPLLPDRGTYEPIDLTIFLSDVRGELKDLIDGLR